MKDRDRQPAVLPTPPDSLAPYRAGEFEKFFPAKTTVTPDLDDDIASRNADRETEKAAWEKHQVDFESLVHEQLIPFMEKHNLVIGTIVSGLGTKAVAKKNKHGFFTVTITKKQYNV